MLKRKGGRILEFKNNIPIYLQVIDDIKHRIGSGGLKLGDKLPSTRELAVLYQINPNTAVRVYNEMESMGICFTKRGLGTFVTEDEEKFYSIKKEMAQDYVDDFVNGMSGLGIDKEEMIDYINAYFKEKDMEV